MHKATQHVYRAVHHLNASGNAREANYLNAFAQKHFERTHRATCGSGLARRQHTLARLRNPSQNLHDTNDAQEIPGAPLCCALCVAFARFLAECFDVVFGYQGGAIVSLINQICERNDIMYVSARNECAAGLSAAAYSKLSGKPSCVVVTSGPGVMQLINGIVDANQDRCPILVVSGRVDRAQHEEFQDVDVGNIYSAAGIHTFVATSLEDVHVLTTQAWQLCTSLSVCCHLVVPKHLWDEVVDVSRFPPNVKNFDVPRQIKWYIEGAELVPIVRRAIKGGPFVIVIGSKAYSYRRQITTLARRLGAFILTRLDAKG